ncbi:MULTISPECIES: TIGR03862 family flavoprotein [Stutzerimonas]|uniref:Predicted flavoprotein n=1 Tax=Stutzerimonas stutzeri (strain A1501) TaxID=379731 RepID=A4VHX7_STUS1|nr:MULTISPECIES: TIGR03862 family flavoprotein [Stutzerimonas]ABP78578.1 predicted flavoprotein [Stutzerimonas stutzeri A1501]MBH3353642.1 TIGR03862 family flavoprotein [Stutzerimonas stutzeri]MCP3431239.1 TIGR03862 family flavoprotein [Stutzerimonas stutzeri]MDH0101092.1 TIGR03862 family flavoprotein [Stutzerimonas stutzeri]MDH0183220.1 TIGR03862 family flavoprotein [Stutzerimonas stutzeri]
MPAPLACPVATMPQPSSFRVAIIGGGPAGLMAAEVLGQAGVNVDLYDAMPSVGRKFLLAGVGGMNITHAEDYAAFVSRYGERAGDLRPLLDAFSPDSLREWIHGLGIDTFVGSSGRVFPSDMKAAPLLRAWLKRLRESGVQLHTRQRWLGWDEHGALRIAGPQGETQVEADATLLALGGGSWARLGSDGAWVPSLQNRGIAIAPLQPANCGFEVAGWSEHLREKFAGAPLKTVSLALPGEAPRKGEFVLTATGIEGSLVYALSAPIRNTINRDGAATVLLDLLPDRTLTQIASALARPRGSQSMAKHLHRQLKLDGVKAALLRELTDATTFQAPQALAAAIKALPIRLVRPRPLDEAISSAGGVPFEELDEDLMLRRLPGVFCAGEMLDWEAPTGGYLLTACFASGRAAAEGMLRWLRANVPANAPR